MKSYHVRWSGKPAMFEATNVERLILEHSSSVAHAMTRIAAQAKSEEDVRHECNKLIENFLDKAGIQPKGRHEYGLAGGRVDSKYGGVILEYKYPHGPGRISVDRDAAGTRAAVEQIKQRFRDFQKEEQVEPERLFAAACDGSALVFVRRRGGKFEVEPQPVTPYAVERLLRALLSLGARGQSFTPDHLAAHFGADSPLAQQGLRDIYSVIKDTSDKKAKTFFSQWKMLFSEVCGYDVEGRNEKIRQLGSHYGLRNAKPAELLFSLHTYYAVFMKFLAAEIAGAFSPLGVSVVKRCVNAATSDKLRHEMENLEQGGIWNELGITNFLEGDLFSWYLSAWEDSMADAVRNIVRKLDEFDPTTLSVDPAESRDLLKKLYQHIFPKSVRHDLGEYYTPDWLAEHVLNETDYSGDPDKRVLDPACGSGTFLVAVVNRIKEWFATNRDQCGYGEEELVQKILKNVIGFDLNPLAVMAARTNYLLAIRDLLKFAGKVELPVYLCDSIMTPANYSTEAATFPYHQFKTAVETFNIPREVVDADRLPAYASTIERCVRQQYTADEFVARCTAEGVPVSQQRLHLQLYNKLCKLDAKNQNGIWARIIKNAFAPIFMEPVDYIVGNPPWINWESLPGEYRDRMKPLWQAYGLFTLSGTAARLGGGKKDISMLFVYACLDNYLVDNGRLGFVITQTVFKTSGAGDGFRNLQFRRNGRSIVIRPLGVDDLSSSQVFEGATNRTAVFVCEKRYDGFYYPVPYTIWRGPSRIDQDASLSEVLELVERLECGAVPVAADDPCSPWLTVPTPALPGVRKVLGKSHYSAYAGCCTWLNSVYWVQVVAKAGSDALLIRNLWDVGEIKVEPVQAAVEAELVYPLLRGRDVSRWYALPSANIILSQDPGRRDGITEPHMKKSFPRAYAYFRRFEEQLRNRSGFRKYFDPTDPFYSMYNVGSYTLAPWKVVWREQSSDFLASVASSGTGRPIVPDHKLMLVECYSAQEAYYLAALLNSSPSRLTVASYVIPTSTSTHVLDRIAIPKYDGGNQLHIHLAELSEAAHDATAHYKAQTVRRVEKEIDRLAAELWKITDDELAAIHIALQEQNRPRLQRGSSESLSLDIDNEPE